MKNEIQKLVCVVSFLILSFTSLLFAQQQAHRVDGSPFPVSSIPETIYLVKDTYYTDAELLTVVTLQGLLAKKSPAMIYRDYGSGYSRWLLDLFENYPVKVNNTYLSNFEGLIEHFKDSVSGYVLCNVHDYSSNTAVSICGILNAIAVTSENVELMNTLGIEMLEDVTSKNEQWAFDNYKDQFSKKILSYQRETSDLFLSSYSVFSNAFQFWKGINDDLTTHAFDRMDDHSVMMGWGEDEYYTVSKASKNSVGVVGSNFGLNLATLTNFEAETKQINHIEDVVTEDDKHTVCFLMSDGDNIQWILSEFEANEAWYASPDRGKFDLGWTMQPALCELAPTALKSIYDRAADSETGRDYFVAGPSGFGYIYPSQFPAIEENSKLLNEYMKKSDLNIVNVIDQPASLEGIKPYLDQDAIDAIFLFSYSDHNQVNGSIEWYNHKPAIAGRFSYWGGFETAESLAEKINNMPRDPKLSTGYSLVSVNVWSNSVSNVKECVDLLDEDIRVVAPDEFVKLINENLQDESDMVNIAPEATVTVSSEYPNANYAKEKVIDGQKSGQANSEWASNGEKKPWVKLSWSEEKSISRIVLYDRYNADDFIQAGTLTFSDGSSLSVGALPNNGAALKIDFPEKKISWVKFQVTTGGGFNVGLTEFEAITTDANTQVRSIQKDAFSVHPNPVSDGFFYADIPYDESFQLEIYNMNGTMVKRLIGYKRNDAINIENLPHGIYTLRLSNARRVLVSSIIFK